MKVQNINLSLINNKSVNNQKKDLLNKDINTNRQINTLSNICYKPLNFGRTWKEHKSWGAVIDPQTKETTFKVLTYPDTKKIIVNVEKNDSGEKKQYELKNYGNGIFATSEKIKAGEVAHGDKYSYTIYKGNGDIDTVKDPYSFSQEVLLGESVMYDHSLYKWNDTDWFLNNKNRISRLANSKNGLQSVNAAKIYEFNVPTLTQESNFEGAKNVLKSIKDDGFNAIEIMPVENTFSHNWGYDGVDKFAPSKCLGGPDELKSLIDYAHELGLNVIMDMVPNHLGPDGASLKRTGPFIAGPNEFGEKFNFEGENSKYVRDFIVNAALNWLDNYHCDGLRLDMTKYMESDTTMKQIAAEVNYHKPDAFLIAEDGRSDSRVTSKLTSHEIAEGKSEKFHEKEINKIENLQSDLSRLGYDSQWDFDYYHKLKDALYGNVDLNALEQSIYNSKNNVKYVMSHDEIGNFEGTRLLAKLMVPILNLNENVILADEDFKRADALVDLTGKSPDEARWLVSVQKAQFLAEKLAMSVQNGEFEYNKTDFQGKDLKPNFDLTYDRVKNALLQSFAKNKMALARTYSLPGPKMVFQGDEKADLTPFRFFRKFESTDNEMYLTTEKGYTHGKPALDESKIGSIKYTADAKELMDKFLNLSKKLNKINSENPALQNGYFDQSQTVKHNGSQLIATLAKDDKSGNEIFSITNFLKMNYPSNECDSYYIKFPKGKWVEILNTDDTEFGGSGNFMNTNIINSNGVSNTPIKISEFSTLMFKKID